MMLIGYAISTLSVGLTGAYAMSKIEDRIMAYMIRRFGRK